MRTPPYCAIKATRAIKTETINVICLGALIFMSSPYSCVSAATIALSRQGRGEGEANLTTRRFPAPWTVEQIPGGFKVVDAAGQSLLYVYARETRAEADIAKVLTFDEARRITVNVAKLPGLVGAR